MSVAEAPPAQATRARGRRRARREFDSPRFLWVFLGLFYLWLFAPILVVALFSFNAQNSLQVFSGFSLRWYDAFFSDPGLRSSLVASLEISLVATLVGTVLGTTLALGLVRARSRIAPTANVLMLIPLVTPEIVAGVSALLLFTQVGLQLSLTTIILAQITFSISYVTVVVRARLTSLNREVEQAAMDLGATRLQTLRLVTLPALWPAIIAAGLLVFALTFDDFVLSFFTTGVSPQPLPVRIYSAIRFGIKPTINAVGTFMLVISMLLVALALVLPWLMGRRGSSIATVMGEETGGRR
jgi:spermidine/putrescine transport system permease protein/putrescine transport system permease protein